MKKEQGDFGRDANLTGLEHEYLDGKLEVVELAKNLKEDALAQPEVKGDDPLIHGPDFPVVGNEIFGISEAKEFLALAPALDPCRPFCCGFTPRAPVE
jgi:hypothetical protein